MSSGLVVALSGGVGGAKLALGLSHSVPPEDLLIVANTGDDFDHLALCISPDIDTLTYVLAGLDNTEQGWGRRDETWSFMDTIGGKFCSENGLGIAVMRWRPVIGHHGHSKVRPVALRKGGRAGGEAPPGERSGKLFDILLRVSLARTTLRIPNRRAVGIELHYAQREQLHQLSGKVFVRCALRALR